MAIIIAFGLILLTIGSGLIGSFFCNKAYGDPEPWQVFGLIPLLTGFAILTGIFIEYEEERQTEISICISDNIETVEEIKTNNEVVQYNITLKDGTKFTVKPIKEE